MYHVLHDSDRRVLLAALNDAQRNTRRYPTP